jgi:hypothetical protein
MISLGRFDLGAPMYEEFIARQSIFDDKLKVFAYELLFRSSPKIFFKPQKESSSSLIADATMLFDLQTLTGNAKAFINLDLPSLQRGNADLLPPGAEWSSRSSRPPILGLTYINLTRSIEVFEDFRQILPNNPCRSPLGEHDQ